MDKPMFLEWLWRQRRKNTPVGDLVREMIEDKDFPEPEKLAWPHDRFVVREILSYLEDCDACYDAIGALHDAWLTYAKQPRRTDGTTWLCNMCTDWIWPDETASTWLAWPSWNNQHPYDVIHDSCVEDYEEEWKSEEVSQHCVRVYPFLEHPTLPMSPLVWRRICAFFDHDPGQQRPPSPLKPNTLSPKERFFILQRDGYRCRLCGASGNDTPPAVLHVDHITPRSKGGTNDPLNLWTLCYLCNVGKGTQEL